MDEIQHKLQNISIKFIELQKNVTELSKEIHKVKIFIRALQENPPFTDEESEESQESQEI